MKRREFVASLAAVPLGAAAFVMSGSEARGTAILHSPELAQSIEALEFGLPAHWRSSPGYTIFCRLKPFRLKAGHLAGTYGPPYGRQE